MAAFCGIVRDQFETDAVSNLELEHYPGMTEKSIESVLDRAEKRWPLDADVVIHRVGSLAPGDQIVLVIATSRHRQAALEACTYRHRPAEDRSGVLETRGARILARDGSSRRATDHHAGVRAGARREIERSAAADGPTSTVPIRPGAGRRDAKDRSACGPAAAPG